MLKVSRQSGFSLLELLIAVVVFSLGLLAIAGMQTVSKQANYEAIQRTTASQVAHGLLEDMRTNGSAIGIYLGAGDLGNGSRGNEPAPNCGAGAVCNAAQKAAYDLWFWEQVLDGTFETTGAGNAAGGLVLPTLCLQGPGGPVAGIYQVTIVWRGSTSLSGNAGGCGALTGNYGAANEFRRIVQVPTYIDPNF